MTLQNVPVQYVTATSRGQKRPVYYVVFGPIGDGDPTFNRQALATEYASGAIKSPTKQRAHILQLPQSYQNQVTPYAGKSSIGGLTFVLQDKAGAVTTLVASYTMKNRLVTIWAGYQDVPEYQFFPLYRGILREVTMTADGVGFQFELADLLRTAKDQVFTAATALAIAMSATQTTAPVYSVQGFAASTDLGDGYGARNYIRIDDEVISYTSLVAFPTYWDFAGCVRGELGTVPTNHDLDAEVVNFVRLEGNPLDLALQVLTSTGLGTNGAYDVLPASQGVGIPVDLVEVAAFENQRDRWIYTMQFRFWQQDKTEAKGWLEENIYKAINAYPVVTNEGKLSVHLYSVPLPTVGTPTLDESAIVGTPKFTGNYSTGRAFFNELEIKYDHDPIVDQFGTIELYENSTSQEKFDEVAPLVYEQRGVRSDLRADIVNLRTVGNIFKRFSTPAPEIQVSAFYGSHLVGVGENVILSHRALPDLRTGRRGILSKLCEVTAKNIDFQRGTVAMTLLATEFNIDRRYGAITPANYPDYLAATETQRLYAFLSNEIVACTVGHMSNGEDGYYVTP